MFRIEGAMNQDPRARLPAFIVSPKDVAARAYELYLSRGATDGFDRDDWLRAEQELTALGRMTLTSAPLASKRRKPNQFRHSVIAGRST